MARRMKRKTRRAIFATLYNDISAWVQQAAELTNNWTNKIDKWPSLKTGIYSYDRPRTKKQSTAAPKLKNVDKVRVDVLPDRTCIMIRKENLCLATFLWDASAQRYVCIISNGIDQGDQTLKPVHKTWFLFYMARRALIHTLTQRGIKAGGYHKVSTDPDNIEVIYDGLRTIYGGSAVKPEPKSSWLRFLKIKAIANKLVTALIKNPDKRKRAIDRVDKFIFTIQNLITANK